MPSAFNKGGIEIPPVELTASIATLNPAFFTNSLSTSFKSIICFICSSIVDELYSTLPRSSTSEKIIFSFFAIRSTFSPSVPEINSPFPFNNLSAFHCFGL